MARGNRADKDGAVVMFLGYLDAGSGSMIASAIAAGAAGAVLFFKMFFRRTVGALSPKRRRAAETASAATDQH